MSQDKLIRLKSTKSATIRFTRKNKKGVERKIELMKFDPILRKRVISRKPRNRLRFYSACCNVSLDIDAAIHKGVTFMLSRTLGIPPHLQFIPPSVKSWVSRFDVSIERKSGSILTSTNEQAGTLRRLDVGAYFEVIIRLKGAGWGHETVTAPWCIRLTMLRAPGQYDVDYGVFVCQPGERFKYVDILEGYNECAESERLDYERLTKVRITTVRGWKSTWETSIGLVSRPTYHMQK